MQKIVKVAGTDLHLNWPEVPDDIQQSAIELWQKHQALPPAVKIEDRAKQVVALARDQDTGHTLAVATVQPEYMGWVGQDMFRYRTFAVQDARLRSISVQMVNQTFDFLLALEGRTEAGLYMEIENRLLMKHQNEGIWFESRCAYVGLTKQGWHKRVRFFPDSCLIGDHLH